MLKKKKPNLYARHSKSMLQSKYKSKEARMIKRIDIKPI